MPEFECVVLPDGQGPSCDWDPDCPDCKRRSQGDTVVSPCQVWPWGEVSEWCLMPLDEICPEHH